jgi:amino acid adenylation domain-containing protein
MNAESQPARQELLAMARRLAALEPDARRELMRKMIERGLNPGRLPILPAARRPAEALSYAQSRQWFLWQLDAQSAAYHLTGALRLKGRLDAAALRGSFDALVARHESLRTVFRANADGLAEQVVLERIELDVHELQASDAADAQRHARPITDAPFDLTQGPLLRVALIHLPGPDEEQTDEHVLVVVMHHIVSDGWSMQVIVDEFAAQYRARVQGHAPVLEPLPIQYADYAAWQRAWLEAGEKDRQLAYWKAQLGTEHPVLQLPSDHPRRADGHYRAARHDVELPTALVHALGRRAQAHGATLFMALLAAFQAVLQRHTAQDDIRVGVPIANRHRAETAGVVGFFVNTQVLRGVISARMPLSQVLQQAKNAALAAQAHQDLPFEQLVEALQPERSRGHGPLFQVLFNHQKDDHRALEQLPGLAMEVFDLGDRAAQFELAVDITEQAGRVQVTLAYASELFDARTIARLADHYLAMLQALAHTPEKAVGDVPLLSGEEQAELQSWSVNEHRYANNEPVHRVIERQAEQTPHATALAFGEVELSYADLNARANRLAHHLIAQGARPEVRVGIAVERSIEMVVGLLAILKAGGAYVPLDPEYPPERLAYMLHDSGVKLLLTQSHLPRPSGSKPQHDRSMPFDTSGRTGLVAVELDTLDLAGLSDQNPQIPLHGEHLAYVIYTSGSTGRPKGAANRHRSLFNRLAWMQQAYPLTADDTVLQKTPFSFDVSVWEFFWPLMVGARLAVAGPGDHRDPARLVELIQQHHVSTLHFVPSMLQAFLAHPGIEACSGLKQIICSGEALPAELQHQVFERLPQARLHNLYGPTEAAIDVTHWTCRQDGLNHVAIGRPIADTKARVLDAELNPVPQGVAGELCLGGIGLARGYLDRPGLTAERFVADPHGQGARLYRTGDLVRWRADGQLEYLGRIDHQVKLRGLRIELGEIEAQLLAQPEVREAVVVAKDARLIAYISGASQLDTEALRAQLSKHLPEYMVPAVFVQLDQLPLNANGKVDRKALPEPQHATRAYEAPQGEIEEALAAIWADVLKLDRVGRHDNFFEIGGHSLAALRLVAASELRFGNGLLTLEDAMQWPVLSEQARRVASPNPCEIQFAQRNGDAAGVPLFCFPGLHVHAFEYGDIVDAVGKDRTVHSFGCYTLSRGRWKAWDFEALAAMHAAHIADMAGSQPVAFLGWSSGGDLAFETARQLKGKVEVRFVGMLDVCHPVAVGVSAQGREHEAEQFDAMVADWTAQSKMATHWRRLFAGIGPGEKALVLDHVREKWWPLPLDGPALGSAEFAAWAGIGHSAMMRRYEWRPSDVPVYSWNADATLARTDTDTDTVARDWAAVAQIRHKRVIKNSDHRTLLKNGDFLKDLRACLQSIDGPGGHGGHSDE